MDTETNPPRAAESSSSDSLAAQLRLFRALYCVATCAMILVAFGGSLLAYRENSVLRVELAGRMEQLKVVRKEYSVREPILREFMHRLQSFAVNYRDFQRVITNNQAVVSRFSAAPGAGAMPVSATPGR